jgi:hypothetical protein
MVPSRSPATRPPLASVCRGAQSIGGGALFLAGSSRNPLAPTHWATGRLGHRTVLELRITTQYAKKMSATLETVRAGIRELPDNEKTRLVDELLVELDQPDPVLDALWLAEVRERREAYRLGQTKTVAYADVLGSFSRP